MLDDFHVIFRSNIQEFNAIKVKTHDRYLDLNFCICTRCICMPVRTSWNIYKTQQGLQSPLKCVEMHKQDVLMKIS